MRYKANLNIIWNYDEPLGPLKSSEFPCSPVDFKHLDSDFEDKNTSVHEPFHKHNTDKHQFLDGKNTNRY